MADFLDQFAEQAKRRVREGYYDVPKVARDISLSLREAIESCRGVPIIAEAKAASPSQGTLRRDVDVAEAALAMRSGGAAGISILTVPDYFLGSLASFSKVRKRVELPLLMKDFVVNPAQLEAAAKIGADAVLLIEALFDRGYCDSSLDDMIGYAHSKDVEVLLEAHTAVEFSSALRSSADLIGINNRDLRTLRVDLGVTERIMKDVNPKGKLIVSESGIEAPQDIRRLIKYGVDAFLVGSSIMKASNIEEKVRELVDAREAG